MDLKGIARALVNNLRGGARQGGSTLTQQYVERYYIGETTSYSGKLKEAVLAIKINREKSKDEVIGAYMNTIYFGRGAYGIDAAAQAYFGHGASQLTLSESALLAAVIPAPSAWDPAVNPEKAKERWDRDLGLMVEDGWISQAEANAAVFPETIDPETLNRESMTGTNGYLMAQVRSELIKSGQFDEDKISQGGLRITSTIVKEHQEQAVAAAEGMNEVRGWDPTHQRRPLVLGSGHRRDPCGVRGRRLPGAPAERRHSGHRDGRIGVQALCAAGQRSPGWIGLRHVLG